MPRARGARLLGALDVDAGAAGGGVPSQSVPPARPWRTLFVWCFGVAVVAAIATLLSDSNRQLTPHGPLVHAVTAQLRRDPTLATPASSIASQIDDVVLPPPASSSVLPADAAAATVSALSDVEPAAEGADVLFAAPAPVPAAADNASLLPDVVVEEDTPKPVPAVAFLFLTINGEVVFPEIWADFFAGAEDEERFNVFIHRSTVRIFVTASPLQNAQTRFDATIPRPVRCFNHVSLSRASRRVSRRAGRLHRGVSRGQRIPGGVPWARQLCADSSADGVGAAHRRGALADCRRAGGARERGVRVHLAHHAAGADTPFVLYQHPTLYAHRGA
jgi:hypothetical protein